MKKINFLPFTENSLLYGYPVPANTMLPEWYKNTDIFLNDQPRKRLLNRINWKSTNTTIKSCSPFLDALTSGYVYKLPADVQIDLIDSDFNFHWRVNGDLITQHSKNQHPLTPETYNGYDFIMKWNFDCVIKTPPGYSTIFTHPFNRHELPFRTFTGIVDTDKYPIPVQFPFQLMQSDFPLIIEKGTPVVQIIPFKRENWKKLDEDYDEQKSQKNKFDFMSKISKAYKSRYWEKKTYK